VLEVSLRLAAANARINETPKPLALLTVSKCLLAERPCLAGRAREGLLQTTWCCSGGARELPFRGVGASGMGKGTAKAGFDTSRTSRSVLRRPSCRFRSPFGYPP